MNNLTRHTGTLNILERLPSSYYGNPRFLVCIDGFTCRTAPDSAYGYSIQNMDGKLVVATIGTYYGHATINTLQAA